MQSYRIERETATAPGPHKITAAGIKHDTIRRLNIEPSLHLPLDVLPDKLREFVQEAETAYGVQPEYTLSGIIFAVSLAIGATHRIEVKRGQYERPCLYMAKIGRPGSNKGTGLKLGLAPIKAREAEHYQEYKRLLNKYRQSLKDGQENEGNKPIYTQYIVKDYSREALTHILEVNPQGVAVLRDELSGWLGDLNRYNGGGEEAYWLSNWSGEAISVNRVSDDPKLIENPFIAVAGTIQPSLLYKLSEGDRKSNGFTDRLLFVWPEDHGKPEWTDNEMPEPLTREYDLALCKILDLGFQLEDPRHPELIGEEWNGRNTPRTVRYSAAAMAAMRAYKNGPIKAACDSAPDDIGKSMQSKYDLIADRLALCLQLLWWSYGEGSNTEISSDIVKKTIRLTDYFRANRLRVHRHLHERSALDDLNPWEKGIFDTLPDDFTTDDAKGIAQAETEADRKKVGRLLKKLIALELTERRGKRGKYSKM
jgi:hypothetical protein